MIGFPVGGDKMAVTEGVVSRIEVVEYSHSYRPSLALTVDAAINAGNSGGPVRARRVDMTWARNMANLNEIVTYWST